MFCGPRVAHSNESCRSLGEGGSSRTIALATAASIHNSHPDYTHPTMPCLVKLSICDSQAGSAPVLRRPRMDQTKRGSPNRSCLANASQFDVDTPYSYRYRRRDEKDQSQFLEWRPGVAGAAPAFPA